MIEVQNLSFARGNHLILKNINLQVHAGEVMVLRGPNGHGKTTLLSNIAKMIEPLEGKIFYQGEEIDDYIASKTFLFIGENSFAFDQLTLDQNIDYWLAIHNVKFSKSIREQSIQYLFQGVNLKKKYYQLSFGQKKKLQLLLLMLVNKPVWILDDPFNGLDIDSINKITTLILKKKQNNGMVVIATPQNPAIQEVHFYEIYC